MGQMTPSDKWMAFHKYDLQMKNPFGKFCRGVWFTDMCSNIHIYNKFSSYAENKLRRYVYGWRILLKGLGASGRNTSF